MKKLLATIPVRKPSPQDFVRVHPDPTFRNDFAVLELKEQREEFIVPAPLQAALASETVNKKLYLAINRQGTVFFWPVRLPTPDGKDMDWWRSGREAAELAMKGWVRCERNMNLGAYDMWAAEVNMPAPEWPELSYYDLIKIAFRDHLIDRIDHPVIKRLRGLA